MAIVVISKGTATGALSTCQLGSLTITAGNSLIVAFAVSSNATSFTLTVVYNNGTTAYPLTGITYYRNSTSCQLFYLDNVAPASGGGTVTATWVSSNKPVAISVYEVSGLINGSLDKETGATGRSSDPSSGATTTTSQANELVVGCIGCASTDGSWNGTVTDNVQSVAGILESAIKIVSATGTYTCSKTGATKDYWAAAVATFKSLTTNIKTLNGLAYASTKTVDGLAMASVKTKDGLA